MEDNDDQSMILGHFHVCGKPHAGMLKLDGPNTRLHIYSDDFFHMKESETLCVRGVSNKGVNISAIYCVRISDLGTASYYSNSRHFMVLQPNYVALGPRYLDPQDDAITSIAFTFSEANNLFYDYGTFGDIIWEHPLSFGQKREILQNVKGTPRHRRRGGHLQLFYRWDRGPILKADCALGSVSVWNATSGNSPSPNGLDLRNRVRLKFSFATPVNLRESLKTIRHLMALCELSAQSKQNVEDIEVEHKDADTGECLQLHSIHQEREKIKRLMPSDALLNGALHSEEFARVVTHWMNTFSTRGAARQRFIEGFREGYHYSIERLIGAANAFDILPNHKFEEPSLPPDVVDLLSALEVQVKAAAKEKSTIKEYKERLLSGLGRVRSRSLRDKALERWNTVPDVVKNRLPDMPRAIAHSVQARNFFVHGSEVKISPDATYEFLPFFSDTLEFVFAMSELHFCGWDAERWAKEHYSLSRCKWFIGEFAGKVKRLDEEVEKKKGKRT